MQTKIAIATGGSGGHVFPALALCEQLKHRDVEYVIIADQRVTSLLQQENARILNIKSTSGKLYKKCIALFSILIATKKVISIFEQEKPHAVIGFGGYPSAPTILASILLKIPFILHEQNMVLGFVNKLFFRAAQAVATSFPATEGLPTDKALFIGNPVRNSVLKLFSVEYEPDINRPINVLVIGGSQGSSEIDNLVTKTVTGNALQHRVNIVHQCRPENVQNVIQSYQQANIIHEVSPFFQDMASKLKDADLIICRAGATTMAENIIAGRPAIYVPFRQSYQDHQVKNARFAALNNIGIFFDVENDSLVAILNSLISNPDKLRRMSEAARAMAKPDAATKLAELVLKHARLKLLAS